MAGGGVHVNVVVPDGEVGYPLQPGIRQERGIDHVAQLREDDVEIT
jgi:hypothetical protein